jgi:hypothetical protein
MCSNLENILMDGRNKIYTEHFWLINGWVGSIFSQIGYYFAFLANKYWLG